MLTVFSLCGFLLVFYCAMNVSIVTPDSRNTFVEEVIRFSIRAPRLLSCGVFY